MSPLRLTLRSLRSVLSLSLAAGAVAGLSCVPQSAPEGLRSSPPGEGPQVVFQWAEGEALSVPFPNDLLTRADRSASTGRRLNLSTLAPTALAGSLQKDLLAHDGFSAFAPITVAFDAPLDVAALDGRGRPFEADPVLVVALGGQAQPGERVALDFGRGLYPLSVGDVRGYFPFGAHAGEDNLLFETRARGRAVANLRPGGDDPVLDLMDWYERETHTLILRPLEPLKPATTYAVVLTEALKGENGESVRSPFDWVHHMQQREALHLLPEALAQHGRSLDEVAFVWTFTTGSITEELEQMHSGLAGQGGWRWLGERFDPEIYVDRLRAADQAPALLPAASLQRALPALAEVIAPEADLVRWGEALAPVAALVGGSFVAPQFLVEEIALPHQEGRPVIGETARFLPLRALAPQEVGEALVPFWCAVPQATAAHQPPFPVVIYLPDQQRSRADLLLWAGDLAAQGFATCGLDLFGQGVRLAPEQEQALDELTLAGRAPEGSPGRPAPLRRSWQQSRARDLDQDGLVDPDGDTFSIDLVHMRDVQRQRVLEVAQFVRVLRSFDGAQSWESRFAGGSLRGDFDGDGRVDFGGPQVAIHLSGQGMGANTALIAGALDPQIGRVAAVSAGGGYLDLLARSAQPGLREGLWSAALGPLVIGSLSSYGETILSFITPTAGALAGSPIEGAEETLGLPFGRELRMKVGDRVELLNLRTGAVGQTQVDAAGNFRVAVAADAPIGQTLWLAQQRAQQQGRALDEGLLGDPLRLSLIGSDGRRRAIEVFDQAARYLGVDWAAGQPLVALSQGLGLKRQSPQLRRWLATAQILLDPADPVHYMAKLVQDPPEGAQDRGVFLLLTAGDTQVPVSAGLSLSRAAGLIDRAGDDALVAEEAVRSLARVRPLVDVDADWAGAQAAPTLARPQRRRVEGPAGPIVLRQAYLGPEGAHGVGAPGVVVEGDWDAHRALVAEIAAFLSGGE